MGLRGWVKHKYKKAKKGAEKAYKETKKGAEKAYKETKKGSEKAYNKTKEGFEDNIIDPLEEEINRMGNLIEDQFKKVTKGIEDLANKAKRDVTSTANSALSTIENKGKSAISTIENKGKGVIVDIEAKSVEVIDKVDGKIKSIPALVEDSFKRALDEAMKAVQKGVFNKAIDIIQVAVPDSVDLKLGPLGISIGDVNDKIDTLQKWSSNPPGKADVREIIETFTPSSVSLEFSVSIAFLVVQSDTLELGMTMTYETGRFLDKIEVLTGKF